MGRDGGGNSSGNGSGNGSGSGSGSGSGGHEQPIDIFPGVMHFTDAITALPKELVKHFTLLKEVDAKIHVPQQALFQLVNDALRIPSPNATRSPYDGTSVAGPAPTSAPMTAQTSASGTGPMVNGQGQGQPQTQNQNHPPSSSDDALNSGVFDRSNLPRRQLFRQVAFEIKEMLVALEEKNHVISTANDALNKQLARIDDIWPHLEQEFSEEAKWGSNNHWAYPENRAAHRANNHAQAERSRREGAANLSAAAQQIADEAAARSDARKQAVAARRSQKNNHHQDSDADSHPHKNDTKKSGGSKSRKPLPETNANAGVGLGISGATTGAGTNGTTGSSSKRRKVEKPAAASTPMERALSGVMGSAAGNTRTRTASPRQSPAPDGTKKRKAVPAAGNQAKKTRNGASAASSPVIGAFPDPKAGQGLPALTNHNFRSPVLRTTGRFDDIAIATGGSIASVLDAANHVHNKAVADAAHASQAHEDGDAKTGAKVLPPPAEAAKAGAGSAAAGGNSETGGPATTNGSTAADKMETLREAASQVPPSASLPGPVQGSAPSAAENSRPVPAPLALSSEAQTNSSSAGAAQAKEAQVPAAAASGAPSTADKAEGDKAAGPAGGSEALKTEAADSPPVSSTAPVKADEAATAGTKKEPTPSSAASAASAASAPAAAAVVMTTIPIPVPIASPAPPTVTTTKSGRASKPSTPALATFSEVPSRSRRPSRSAETSGSGGSGNGNGGSNSGNNSASSGNNSASSGGSGTTKRSHKKGASISSQAHAQAAAAAAAQAAAAAAASNGGSGDATNGNGYNSSGSGGSGGSSTRHHQQHQQRQNQAQNQTQNQDEDESDPLYCYCQQISFGEMIACDAEDCAREWFHLECVGLRVAPKANVKWYCDDCKKRLKVGERKSNGR